MKLSILILLIATQTFAHVIEGTPILKGKIRGTGNYLGEKVECSIFVSEVKNEFMEDQFGNPSYKVEANVKFSTEIRINGKKKSAKISKNITFTNRAIRTNLVSDTDYRSVVETDEVEFKANSEGRLVEMSAVVLPKHKVKCTF
jgi:uncharacterized protein YxjI